MKTFNHGDRVRVDNLPTHDRFGFIGQTGMVEDHGLTELVEVRMDSPELVPHWPWGTVLFRADELTAE